MIQTAVGKLLRRSHGCTPRLALRPYNAMSTSVQTQALPPEQLERQHHMAIRRFMRLPHQPPVASTLAGAQIWPLRCIMWTASAGPPEAVPSFRVLGANHPHGWDRSAHSLLNLFPRLSPLDVHFEPDNLSKRRTPACELHQSAVAKLHDRTRRHLPVFAHGALSPSVLVQVVGWNPFAVACVTPIAGTTTQCSFPFHASSTTAELAGLHLAADYLVATTPQLSVAILCDSRPALQARLVPSHVEIAGEEEAAALTPPLRH
ncbi:hypothetical protein HPB52_002800 [Rhipicephalus sanguineus]|uniref:Tick transposon n=1 Tax=Rhipicephalus sanguineus TaxID=34632 RepID=A0A9D4SVI8_RHISA|nr:hypothetical protein HPB52_002800 [Rhipicephalus sanguineus]